MKYSVLIGILNLAPTFFHVYINVIYVFTIGPDSGHIVDIAMTIFNSSNPKIITRILYKFYP